MINLYYYDRMLLFVMLWIDYQIIRACYLCNLHKIKNAQKKLDRTSQV